MLRCYACYGFGRMSKECKVGRVCRKCCEKGHMMSECRKSECCGNCVQRDRSSEHSVLSSECPEYVRVLA